MTSTHRSDPLTGDALPTLDITAVNTAADSSNKIHDDAEAKRYGYGGGLVPGVTLYAYLTQLAIGRFGAAWLERGTADFSIRRPVYEGETVRCEGEADDADAGRLRLSLRVLRDGVLCADGTFGLGTDTPQQRQTLEDGPAVIAAPPPLRPDIVPLNAPLAPIHATVSAADAREYAESTSDPTAWYRGDSPFGGALVPPGWLAGRQAALLRANFEFGPSIHTRSVVRHIAPAFAGRTYTTAGVIRETFERKGNHYLVMDAETRDDQERIVFRVQHTSIFSVRMASPA